MGVLVIGASGFAAIAAAFFVSFVRELSEGIIRQTRVQKRLGVDKHSVVQADVVNKGVDTVGLHERVAFFVLRLAQHASHGKEQGTVSSLGKRPEFVAKVEDLFVTAGYKDAYRVSDYVRARRGLAFSGAAAGAFVSIPFGLSGIGIGAVIGFFCGRHALDYCLKTIAIKRRTAIEREMPQMLEVLALGVSAGLSFDAAFELYAQRNDSLLGGICKDAHLLYTHGPLTRDEALMQTAEDLQLPSFDRFVDTLLQALHFGAALAEVLQDSASDIRAEYRNKVKVRIAKAPVKMIIPTGTLILPAMLILVMGPIAINMADGIL